MTTPKPITLDDIERAKRAIQGTIEPTPLRPSPSLTKLTGREIHLKFEHHQVTGSFKIRGATNAVGRLDAAQQAAGVVGVSTGNHGRGLAYAARAAGVRCIICMSSLVPQNKIDGIQALGAEVRIVGTSQDEAQFEVDRLVTDDGMTMIPPFDHPHIIAGQGTLGLDVLEQLPGLETAIVPVSGGGLISGVALALKSKRPEVRIVGVSMERGAAMYASQKAGAPVLVDEEPTLADSLGGGIGLDNRYTFHMVHELVDDIVLVDEAAIAAAIRHAYWEERQIVEGSGAVGIAALQTGKAKSVGPTAVLMCGGNIDMTLHHQIVAGEDVDLKAEG